MCVLVGLGVGSKNDDASIDRGGQSRATSSKPPTTLAFLGGDTGLDWGVTEGGGGTSPGAEGEEHDEREEGLCS